MHKILRVELERAQMHFSEGASVKAQQHIRIALRLYEAAPFGSIPPQVGNAIMWASNAAAERDVTIMALDQVLRLLDENAARQERR
jgi:hypothetical protein